jgi:hypothetical protein
VSGNAFLKWLNDTFGLLLLALLLAFIVWVAAVFSADPNEECSTPRSVPLQVLGLPDGFLLFENLPDNATVRLFAPRSVCQAMAASANSVQAYIDLAGLEPGEHELTVTYDISDNFEPVLFQQTPELQQGGAVGYALSAQVDAHEAAQSGAVQQRFLARLIGQVEPVLHEVHPQHALQPDRRAAVAGLGVVRLDHLAQRLPRDDLVHRGQEHIALGRSAVLLEPGALIGGCGKGLLLHRRPPCSRPSSMQFARRGQGLVQRCPNV